jgi:hypothetical protein
MFLEPIRVFRLLGLANSFRRIKDYETSITGLEDEMSAALIVSFEARETVPALYISLPGALRANSIEMQKEKNSFEQCIGRMIEISCPAVNRTAVR